MMSYARVSARKKGLIVAFRILKKKCLERSYMQSAENTST